MEASLNAYRFTIKILIIMIPKILLPYIGNSLVLQCSN